MGLLDFMYQVYPENKSDLEYNDDGFLTPHKLLTIRFENKINYDVDDGYNEPDELESFPTEEVLISIELISSIAASEYTYDLHIFQDDSYGRYVAYGEVKIYLASDENNNRYINDVVVNGVSNGPLHDKYNDCFIIYACDYFPVLCPNIPCNFPYRPDFDDSLNEDE